jgi:hypothetical protein
MEIPFRRRGELIQPIQETQAKSSEGGKIVKLARRTAVRAATIVYMLGFGGIARAQNIDPGRLEAAQTVLAQIHATLESLPDAHQKLLSSGAQNLLRLAHGWDQVQNGLADADIGELQSKHSIAAGQPLPPDALVSRITNPATDFSFSTLAGFTQSESSTAWCGDNVVTGFNDSGSVFETLLFTTGGLGFSGASFSTDKGKSFQDMGFINPGSDPNNFLAGDPVVTCVPSVGGSVPVFYYTQLFSKGPPNAPLSAIAISKSANGGAAWGDPITTVQKNGFTHFLDKDWSAIDPTNPNRIFVTYTDFDTSSTRCPPRVQRTAIELVESVDGGVTWTAPLIVTESCFAAPNYLSVQGSQVLFDPAGNAYVAWEDFSNPTQTTRNLRIRKSADHGKTFSPVARISSVTYTGDGQILQGGIRNNEFPMLAVDRHNGTIYVVWNDGRNFSVRDVEAGRYRFADVLLSKSADGGQTWSAPVRVNQDPLSHLMNGQPYGTDHYQPGVAVDKSGRVGVCWYDRRNDPKNFTFGRFCSFSTDGGANWHDPSSFLGNWQPFHDMDVFVAQYYLGDYDIVASDLADRDNGFLGAFGFVDTNPQVPNQDVAIIKFP